MVLAGNEPANLVYGTQSPPASSLCKAPPRSARIRRGNHRHSQNTSKQSSEQNRKERVPYSEKRADHQHHFYVAQAHTLAAPHQLVQCRGSPKQKTRERAA